MRWLQFSRVTNSREWNIFHHHSTEKTPTSRLPKHSFFPTFCICTRTPPRTRPPGCTCVPQTLRVSCFAACTSLSDITGRAQQTRMHSSKSKQTWRAPARPLEDLYFSTLGVTCQRERAPTRHGASGVKIHLWHTALYSVVVRWVW